MKNRQSITSAIPIAVTAAGLLWPSLAAAQSPAPADIDLDRALELARKNSPVLEAARYSIAETKGDLAGASVLLANNPEISASAGRRREAAPLSELSLDYEVELSQRFEIGGQRGHRVDSATAAWKASKATADDIQRVVGRTVTATFFEALAADRRLQIRKESEKLAEGLLKVATKRLERGAGAPLEVNTARIRRAEAKRRLIKARAESRTARLRLKQLLGLPPARTVALTGVLPTTALNQSEDLFVAHALQRRPDLVATTLSVEAAKAQSKLANAEAWPDVSLFVSYGREESDRIIMAGLRVSLPLFNRNQGQRERARATVRRVQAEKRGKRLAVDSEVRRAYTAYTQARDALSLYDAEVLEAQKESLALLQRAFESGKVGYADVILVQRELLEGREGLLTVRLEFASARAALFSSANIPQTTATKGELP